MVSVRQINWNDNKSLWRVCTYSYQPRNIYVLLESFAVNSSQFSPFRYRINLFAQPYKTESVVFNKNDPFPENNKVLIWHLFQDNFKWSFLLPSLKDCMESSNIFLKACKYNKHLQGFYARRIVPSLNLFTAATNSSESQMKRWQNRYS